MVTKARVFTRTVDQITKRNGIELGAWLAGILISLRNGPLCTGKLWRPGSAALRAFERRGIVERNRGTIRLIDPRFWK